MKALVAMLILASLILPSPAGFEMAVFDLPREAPADTPFHVADAWESVSDQPAVLPAFELRLDGHTVVPPHTLKRVGDCDGVLCLQVQTFYSFPNGLRESTYLFNALWPTTCAASCSEVRLAAQRMWITTFSTP